MSSAEDQIANRVLQESYCDITQQLNVSEVSARLYTNHRITLTELNQLHNVSVNLTDLQLLAAYVALPAVYVNYIDTLFIICDKPNIIIYCNYTVIIWESL